MEVFSEMQSWFNIQISTTQFSILTQQKRQKDNYLNRLGKIIRKQFIVKSLRDLGSLGKSNTDMVPATAVFTTHSTTLPHLHHHRIISWYLPYLLNNYGILHQNRGNWRKYLWSYASG